MKLLSLITFLLVAHCVPVCRAQSAAQGPPLQLTAEIVGQKYCPGSEGLDFLHMRIRLRYVNNGSRRLILYRGGNLFFMVWINSRPDRDLSSDYELKTSSARFLTRRPEDVDKPSPNRDFVGVPAGGTVESEITVSLPVAREKSNRIDGAITAGEHLLRIRASTWYESRILGERLRERWRRKGLLWLDPVITPPVRFSSDAGQPEKECR